MNTTYQKISVHAGLLMWFGILIFAVVCAHTMKATPLNMDVLLALFNPLMRTLPDAFLQKLNLLAHGIVCLGFAKACYDMFKNALYTCTLVFAGAIYFVALMI